jgi:pentose-5-phosphate-3-epimerase
MTRRVDIVFSRFTKLGRHVTGSHPEATENLDCTLFMIHGLDCEAERAFNPSRSPSLRDPLATQVAHAMQPMHLEIDASVEVGRIRIMRRMPIRLSLCRRSLAPFETNGGFAQLSTPCVMKC